MQSMHFTNVEHAFHKREETAINVTYDIYTTLTRSVSSIHIRQKHPRNRFSLGCFLSYELFYSNISAHRLNFSTPVEPNLHSDFTTSSTVETRLTCDLE